MKENEEENLDACTGSCHSCAGCGHDHDEYESNGMSPIITLTDDDGNDVKFEILDVVVMDDEKEYLIVSEVKEEKEESDVEVVILEIKEENGEEVYDTVTDETVAQAVFDEFVKQQNDEEE